jgi:HSP20 family protein
MSDKQNAERREEAAIARREVSPVGTSRRLERLETEMDRLFDTIGLGREWLGRRPGGRRLQAGPEEDVWFPEMEMFQRHNELVIRADLPGMTKDNVKVEVADDAVTIQGERKWEHKEEREGVYRSERSYGSFYRTLPLPEGAIGDQAKATFKNGVLEITMPAPPETVKHGRRIEIA